MILENVVASLNDTLWPGEERLIRAFFSAQSEGPEADPMAGLVVRAVLRAAEDDSLDENQVIEVASLYLAEMAGTVQELSEKVLRAIKKGDDE